MWQPGHRSCFCGWARDGSSGVGSTDFSLLQGVQNDSGAHPISYSKENGFLSLAWSGQSVKPTTHLHLQPSFRMSESMPVFFICAVMIWTRQSSPLIKRTDIRNQPIMTHFQSSYELRKAPITKLFYVVRCLLFMILEDVHGAKSVCLICLCKFRSNFSCSHI